MDIEKQVVSLDLAKQLKEAGYKQDTSMWIWTWDNEDDTGYVLFCVNQFKSVHDEFMECEYEYWDAPTVAELGEALPEYTKSFKDIIYALNNPLWSCSSKKQGKYYFSQADTEADVRAKMWLYLKKEGLL